MKKLLVLATCTILFAACASEETPTTDPTPDTSPDTTTTADMDTTAAALVLDTTAADTLEELGTMGMMTEEEQAALEAEEEAKKADAWEFCDCVREQKRLSDALLEEDDDAKFDAIMAEMDALEDKCPDLGNPGNQTSMDEKKAYERRVKKCLKGS